TVGHDAFGVQGAVVDNVAVQISARPGADQGSCCGKNGAEREDGVQPGAVTRRQPQRTQQPLGGVDVIDRVEAEGDEEETGDDPETVAELESRGLHGSTSSGRS